MPSSLANMAGVEKANSVVGLAIFKLASVSLLVFLNKQKMLLNLKEMNNGKLNKL